MLGLLIIAGRVKAGFQIAADAANPPVRLRNGN